VDDGLVDKEKIGGTNYYWSFPAKKDRQLQVRHEQLLVQIDAFKKQNAEADANLADAKRGREEVEEEEEEVVDEDDDGGAATAGDGEGSGGGDDGNNKKTTTKKKKVVVVSTGRAAKLARLGEIRARRAALEDELSALKQNDPAAVADLEKEFRLCRDAAHRWTDNVFNAKDYLVKKRGMDKKEALRILGITSAFDCK